MDKKLDEHTSLKVILFGGGDAGGLLIGPHGVRPIPPFDPSLLGQIKAVASLTQSLARKTATDQRELTTLTTKLANIVVGEVEAVVGRLGREASLIYQDPEGGFSCGTTGLPPIPILWPPHTMPGLDDLLTSGLVENELVRVLSDGKVDVKALLADPRAATAAAGVHLSERSIAQLSQLMPENIEKISEPEGREIARFFHKVVEDGRFLESWVVRPHEAAEALGVKLSDRAVDRLIAGRGSVLRPHTSEAPAIAIGIVVSIVIGVVVVSKDPFQIAIRDRSGIRKF